MTQPQLAEAANIGLSTVVDFEKQRRAVSESVISSIRSALERAGVEFIDDVEVPGVRIKFESAAEEAFFRNAATLFPGSKAWKRTAGPDFGVDFVGIGADGETIFVEVKAAHVDRGSVAQQFACVRTNHPDARLTAILMGGPPSSEIVDGVEIYQVPFVGKWDALPRPPSGAGGHELRRGDNVRLRRGSALWKSHANLRKAVGRVAELIDDGTSLRRISVSYPDGEGFEGVVAGLFEYMPPDQV